MLVTQFALVMGQVAINRCGPPVSFVDPSRILQASSRFAHSRARRGRVPWSGGIEGVVVNLSDVLELVASG